MRRTLVLALLLLAACEDKPAAPPAPTPVAAAPEPVAAAPVAAPAPTEVAGKPAPCGWDNVRVGQRVLYQASSTSVSGGGAKRVGGEIVQAGGSDGPSFELKVIARQGDRAWAWLGFRNAKLPDGMPGEFILEVHDAPSKVAEWQPPHDAIRPAQLTVDGTVFNCQDHVKSPPQASHTCIQPAPSCLFWLDGLVRRWRFPTNDTRQMLELTHYAPPSNAAPEALPKGEQGGHFAGAWAWRPDPFRAVRVRYFVEGGQLVRESTPFKLWRGLKPEAASTTFKLGENIYVRDGAPERETTPFRDWVLDLLDGNPVPATWIPAKSQAGIEFVSFPG